MANVILKTLKIPGLADTFVIPDEAEVAKKVANSLTVKVNGTSIGSFDGSAAKTMNIQTSAATIYRYTE